MAAPGAVKHDVADRRRSCTRMAIDSKGAFRSHICASCGLYRGSTAWTRLYLARINASPAGMAKFFERIGRDVNDSIPNWLQQAIGYASTHPGTRARAETAHAAVQPGVRYAPALSPEQWADVRAMCQHPDSRDTLDQSR